MMRRATVASSMAGPSNIEQRIEIGGSELVSPNRRGPLVFGSYNIRYAVGSRLISSGLMRKVGYNFPTRRQDAVAQHIRTAAAAFSKNSLLPPPDILALQEADKGTA